MTSSCPAWARVALDRRLLDQAAEAVDRGEPAGHAICVLELALRLSGNHGRSPHNPLEHHHRDVLCSRGHAPQDDSIRVAAGLAALDQ